MIPPKENYNLFSKIKAKDNKGVKKFMFCFI